MTEAGPLRRLLEETAEAEGVPMDALTVLAAQNDPFRVDTPACHRDGEWLAITARELGLGERKIHLRGLHYMVLGRPKPNGEAYANTEADWLWLSGKAGKAARWLGYLPFDQITDQRNAAPEVTVFEEPDPWAYLTVDVDIKVPAVLKVGAQHEPSWADQGLDEHQVLDRLRAQLGEAEHVGTYPADGWQWQENPVGPCQRCSWPAHTAGPDGQPVHAFCWRNPDPVPWWDRFVRRQVEAGKWKGVKRGQR